jgi:hypothetical protein
MTFNVSMYELCCWLLSRLPLQLLPSQYTVYGAGEVQFRLLTTLALAEGLDVKRSANDCRSGSNGARAATLGDDPRSRCVSRVRREYGFTSAMSGITHEHLW